MNGVDSTYLRYTYKVLIDCLLLVSCVTYYVVQAPKIAYFDHKIFISCIK